MVKFNIEDLPNDVTVVENENDDDDDQDKRGKKITAKQFIKKSGEIYEEYSDEEEKASLIQNEDDDNNDDDEDDLKMYGTPKSKRSYDDYKSDIGRFTNEKDKLLKELEKNRASVTEMESVKHNLEYKLKEYKNEIELLKQIDDSARRDYRDLKIEYDKQVEEIHDLDINNKELKRKLEDIRKHYDQELEYMKSNYERSLEDSSQEIERIKNDYDDAIKHIRSDYESKIKQMKTEYLNLKEIQKEKDTEIKNLHQSLDEGNTIAAQISNELESYKKKYHDLENQRNKDLQSLAQKMNQQQGNYEATRQTEISQLSQALEKLEIEKNQYQNKINELETELTNTKNYANTEYNKLKNEKELEIQNTKNYASQKYDELIKQKEEEEKDKDRVVDNYLSKFKQKEAMDQRKIQEQEERIKRLTSQLQSIPRQNVSLPEKIEEEIPIILPIHKPQREGMLTRSQGPANTGQEIVEEIFDQQGNLIWKGMEFELAGKPYSAADFILNLIKYNTTDPIKNFKNAYELRQQALGDKTTYNNQKYVNKAIEILNQQLDYDKHKVALVMKHIIDKEKVLKEFSNIYNKDYAQYIKK